jgi:autotransporter-associated beta strand protein
MSVSRFAFSICLATVLFGLASHAQAVITWDNGDTTWEWNTANNWNPNTVPTSGSGSDALFDSTSPSGTPITVTGPTPSTRHLSFGTAGGGLFPVASYTFNPGPAGVLNLRSATSTTLANSSSTVTTQTFNVPVSANNTLIVVTMGGSFVFNGTTNVGANLSFVDGDLDGIAGAEVGSSIHPVTFNGGLTGGAVNMDSSIVVTVGAGGATYTGATNVNQGTYRMNGAHTGGGAYTVASGATLAGTGTIDIAANNMTVNGTLSPGASIESLGVTATLVELNGTLFIEFDDTASPKIDLLNVTGNLDITDATLSLDDISLGDVGLDGVSSYIFATYTGSLLGAGAFDSDPLPAGYEVDYDFGGNSIALVPVPEPGAIALASLGCIGLGLLRMRKQA